MLRVREASIAELQAHQAGLQQLLTDREAAAEELHSQLAAAAPAPAHVKCAEWRSAAAAQPATSEGAEGIAGHDAAVPDTHGQGTQQRVVQLEARLAEQAEQLAARDQLLEEQAADIKSAIEQLTGLQEVRVVACWAMDHRECAYTTRLSQQSVALFHMGLWADMQRYTATSGQQCLCLLQQADLSLPAVELFQLYVCVLAQEEVCREEGAAEVDTSEDTSAPAAASPSALTGLFTRIARVARGLGGEQLPDCLLLWVLLNSLRAVVSVLPACLTSVLDLMCQGGQHRLQPASTRADILQST